MGSKSRKRKLSREIPHSSSVPPWLYLAVLMAAILVAYFNSFSAGWQFDDGPNILNNSQVQAQDLSPNTLSLALSSRVGGRRPISYLTFAINHYFSQLDPKPYHAVNIFLHCVNACLVFWMVRLVTGEFYPNLLSRHHNLFSLFVTSLWSLNPLQTQAVSLIVQRMTLLASLFSLLSFILFLLWRRSQSGSFRHFYLVGSLGTLLLAFGSKENALILPFVIWVYEYLRRRTSSSSFVPLLPWLAVLTLLGAVLIWKMEIPQKIQTDYSNREYSMSERLLTQPRVITTYISQLLLPLPSRLALRHEVEPSTSLFSPGTTLPSLLLIGGLLGGSLFAMRRRPFLAFWILWFFMTLSIESSILPLEMAFEHRLYLPSIGFFSTLLALPLISSSRRIPIISHPAVSCGIILLSLISALLTFQRNRVWKDEVSLWENNLQRYPGSVRVLTNLSSAYIKAGKPYLAEQTMTRAFKTDPSYLEARTNLALFYLGQNKVDEAVSLIDAVPMPRREMVGSTIFFNFGVIYAKAGQLQKAIDHYREAIHRDPSVAEPWFNLALVYTRLSDRQNTRLCLQEFLARWGGELDNPYLLEAQRRLATLDLP